MWTALLTLGMVASLTSACGATIIPTAEPTPVAVRTDLPVVEREPAPTRAAAQPTAVALPTPTRRPIATLRPVTVPSGPTPCGEGSIDSRAAIEAIGRESTVYLARVDASHRGDLQGEPTFLNDFPFPNHRFTAVVWGSARPLFDPPPERWHGRPACVRGMVVLFQERPQIEVRDPAQLWDPRR